MIISLTLTSSPSVPLLTAHLLKIILGFYLASGGSGVHDAFAAAKQRCEHIACHFKRERSFDQSVLSNHSPRSTSLDEILLMKCVSGML